jgi:glycosyltransferase involved in cell wall biosynthesis
MVISKASNMNKITALIRFKDSDATLETTLKSLDEQSIRVDRILAVDTGSSDRSRAILQQHGADIVHWTEPYHAAKVLNFGMSHCTTPYVLILSSHTAMQETDTIERLLPLVERKGSAAASIKWDDDPYYSDSITQEEIQQKGMKFGSIYSNSLGLLRHKLWQEYPFETQINGLDDYDWALHQLQAGYTVHRIDSKFSYRRSGHNRDLRSTGRCFMLADRYNLKVRWLGSRAALMTYVRLAPKALMGDALAKQTCTKCYNRLCGRLFWKFIDLNIH